ncbi:MAG: roadblock/LC7 domain-containing protein [Promethearchaeota archaeon]
MLEIKDKLVKLLDNFNMNTKISCSTLITEDGLIIASNSEHNYQDEEEHTNFAALSASMLSMAERGIEIINANKNLQQIKIDASNSGSSDSNFSILITRVIANILIQMIFPKEINIGLIDFEISKLTNEVRKIVQQNSFKEELFTNIGSLL